MVLVVQFCILMGAAILDLCVCVCVCLCVSVCVCVCENQVLLGVVFITLSVTVPALL